MVKRKIEAVDAIFETSSAVQREERSKGAAKPVGKPWWTNGSGEKFYDRLERTGHEYSIGNCILVRIDDKKKPLSPADIIYIWSNSVGDVSVEVRWLYEWDDIPENLRKNGRISEEMCEVYETDHSTVIDADSIERPIEVLSKEEFLKRKQSNKKSFQIVNDSSDDLSKTSDKSSLSSEEEEEEGDEEIISVRFCSKFYSQKHWTLTELNDLTQRLQRARLSSTLGKVGPNGHGDGRLTKPNKVYIGNEGSYQYLMKQLQLSSAPDKLLCREEEADTVKKFISDALVLNGPTVMLISGMPGTGKTATVQRVVHNMQVEVAHVKAEKLCSFEFIEINGMKLREPSQVYAQLWTKISGEKKSPQIALGEIENYFSLPNKPKKGTQQLNRDKKFVLLLDEIDSLASGKQRILHTVFNWPVHSKGRLVIIGIANTLNLGDSYLPQVNSRLGTCRLLFSSYSSNQVVMIIKQRLGQEKVFDNNAIVLASKKVALFNGDIRQALHLCRRALEISYERACGGAFSSKRNMDNKTEVDSNIKVTMDDIHMASREENDAVSLMMTHGTSLDKMIIVAVTKALHVKKGKEMVSFQDVESRLHYIFTHSKDVITEWNCRDFEMPTSRELLYVIDRMAHSGVLRTVMKELEIYPRVGLTISPMAVARALRADSMSRHHMPDDLTSALRSFG